MTACVNRKHTKKVAAVVTASLVGALSLGVAPVAAMATEGEISLQALDAVDAFEQGKMTEARDGQNRRLDIPSDGIITVEAGKWVVPTEITPKDADPVEIVDYVAANQDTEIQNAEITYGLPDGTTVANSKVTDADFKAPGTYTVNVKMIKGDYASATFTTKFIVEAPADLSNATLFDMSDGEDNVSDTTFTYNGKPQEIGVAVDGKVVDDTTYTIVFDQRLDADGNPVTKNNVTPEDAGTYLANISDASGLKAKVTFTVNRVDLSSADVFVADVDTVDSSTTTVSTVYIDGVPFNTSGGDISTLVDAASGQTGKASAIVTPTKNNKNVIGKATVEFNVVEHVLTSADVLYNEDKLSDIAASSAGALEINLADGESFKPERFEVTYTDGTGKITYLDPSYYTVTYTDANGDEVDASALANPGKYTATVRVNAEASHFVYGCENITMKVNVKSATVDPASDIVFKYDGKVGNSFEDFYSGEDFLPQIETIVHTKWGDDLVAGTDYTVTAYKGDEKVDAIVDEGTYTVKLEIKGTGDEDQCTFVVKALPLTYGLYVNGGDLTSYTWDEDGNGKNDSTVWYLGYTGEVLEPKFELGYYTNSKGEIAEYHSDISADLTWNALPSEAYTVTGYQFDKKDVDEVKDKGEYKVQFALENSNYDIPKSADDEYTANAFTVSTDRVAFADVDPSEWYAEPVFEAKQLGYIKGIQGSNLYAPNASITRADALVIISRMAGADVAYGEDWLSQNIGYVTRYSDVDANAYYAKAIAWATKVGIVHGYGDGTFAPDKAITREEFAAMMANYAKAAGKFEAAADTALDSMPDASSVSGWAKESVAWAVENKVMGNGGFIGAQTDISRAEVAAMAVNYQPDGISSSVIG